MGIDLNALHDKAFDRGLITFDTDLRLVCSKALQDHFADATVNQSFQAYEPAYAKAAADNVQTTDLSRRSGGPQARIPRVPPRTCLREELVLMPPPSWIESLPRSGHGQSLNASRWLHIIRSVSALKPLHLSTNPAKTFWELSGPCSTSANTFWELSKSGSRRALTFWELREPCSSRGKTGSRSPDPGSTSG